jgi:hydrogenase/urease accessory protein HupE
MRTVLASLALASTGPAFAHEGHGESGFHWHGGDLLGLLAMAVAVGLWLWQRSQR